MKNNRDAVHLRTTATPDSVKRPCALIFSMYVTRYDQVQITSIRRGFAYLILKSLLSSNYKKKGATNFLALDFWLPLFRLTFGFSILHDMIDAHRVDKQNIPLTQYPLKLHFRVP